MKLIENEQTREFIERSANRWGVQLEELEQDFLRDLYTGLVETQERICRREATYSEIMSKRASANATDERKK